MTEQEKKEAMEELEQLKKKGKDVLKESEDQVLKDVKSEQLKRVVNNIKNMQKKGFGCWE